MSCILYESHSARPEVLAKYNDLLSVGDLAEIFEVSKQTVCKEIQQGKFGEPIKIGRAYKIPKIYVIQRYFCGYDFEKIPSA